MERRLGHIEQARGHYDETLLLYEIELDPVGKMNTWISLARLEAALGRHAEADAYYQQVFRVADQIGFGDHPVVKDWKQEYAQLTAAQTGQAPFAAALDALLAVNSLEALEQTLAQHPVLLELSALERLGSGILQMANVQPDMARRLLALSGVLLDRYNRAHAEQVDLAEHARFVALHEALASVAESLDEDLTAGLRESLGWALNTLGNAHAEQDDHAAAVEAYTRAIVHTPENAMLYRNRAGEYLELQQWAQAEADIVQAAALDPDAPRLAKLPEALAAGNDQ